MDVMLPEMIFQLFRVTYCNDIALIKLDFSYFGEPQVPEDVELQKEPIETSRDLSKCDE